METVNWPGEAAGPLAGAAGCEAAAFAAHLAVAARLPPGFHRRPVHEIDGILHELHSLARTARDAPDTS